MARGLFAVLENEIIEPVEAPQDERVVELEEQVAQGEVAEASQEVEEAGDTVDEAVTAIEELSEVADVMADSAEEGEGLTEDAAEIAEVAVEAICARLGYKPSKKPIPSMEAFGSTSSRLDATKYALEGIADTIRNIWNAIKGFFGRIWEGIKGLWARLFDAGTKIKVRAEKLDEKLKAAEDGKFEADKEKKIDAAKFCTVFNAKSGDVVAEAAIEVLGAHGAAVAKQAKINAELVSLFEKAEKADSVDEVKSVMQASVNSLVGDKNTYAFGNTMKAETDEAKGVTTFSLTQSETKVEKAEIAPVALGDLKDVLGSVKEFQKTMEAAKANVAKAEATVKKGIAAAEKLSKDEKADAEVSKARASAFKNGQAALVIINSKLPALGTKAASAALDFVATNLAAYKAA